MVKVPTYRDLTRQGTEIRPTPIRSLSDAEIQNLSNTGIQSFAKGMEQASASVEQIEKIKEKRNKEDNLLWVTTNIAEFKTQVAEQESGWQETYDDPSGAGFTEFAENEFNKIKDELLANAPNDEARDALAVKIEAWRPAAVNSFLSYQTETRYAHLSSEMAIAINKTAMLSYKNPLEWEMHLGSITGMLDGVYDPEDEPKDYLRMLPPKMIETIRDSANNKIISNALEGLIDSNEKEKIDLAINWIKSGIFDDKVNEDTLIQLLNKATSHKEKVSALALENLNQSAKANLSNIAIHGHELSPLTLSHFTLLSDGTKDGIEKATVDYNNYASSVVVGKAIYANNQLMTWYSDKALTDMINTLEPPDKGDPKYKDKPRKYNEDFAIYSGTIEAANEISKRRDANPVEYILSNDKNLANAYAGLEVDDKGIEEGFDENAEYKIALDKVINLQKSMGITNIKYMTNQEENDMIKALTNSDPGFVKAYMTQERAKVGEWADERLSQVITSGNLSQSHAAALMWLDEPEFHELWKAVNMDSKTLDDGIAHIATDSKNITTALAPFEEWREALTINAPDRLPFVNSIQGLLLKRAKLMLASGNYDDLDAAMEGVIDDHFASKFTISDGPSKVLIPIKIMVDGKNKWIGASEKDLAKINGVLNMMLEPDAVNWYDVVPLDSVDPNISDLPDYREDAQNISSTWAWRNTADGLGVELIYNFNSPYPDSIRAVTKDGKPIIFTWEQISFTHFDPEASTFEKMMDKMLNIVRWKDKI